MSTVVGQRVEPLEIGGRRASSRSLAGSNDEGPGVHVLRELEQPAQTGRIGRERARRGN